MSLMISVVIPAHNVAAYLREALTSVSQQTLQPNEIIVIDDGSTDETAHVVQQAGATYRYQTQMGAAAARNHGVALAQGDYLAFLDADDLWEPDKLAQQAAVLANNPYIDMVFGHIAHFVSPELPANLRKKMFCPAEAQRGYLPSALMIRRASWQRVGKLASSWQVGEFVNWYLQAQEIGLRDYMLPETVAKRRLHRLNQGVLKRAARRDYLHILKATLDRRRLQHGV